MLISGRGNKQCIKQAACFFSSSVFGLYLEFLIFVVLFLYKLVPFKGFEDFHNMMSLKMWVLSLLAAKCEYHVI